MPYEECCLFKSLRLPISHCVGMRNIGHRLGLFPFDSSNVSFEPFQFTFGYLFLQLFFQSLFLRLLPCGRANLPR
jgi:hypothetical protein